VLEYNTYLIAFERVTGLQGMKPEFVRIPLLEIRRLKYGGDTIPSG
jgi:hypothetical protein